VFLYVFNKARTSLERAFERQVLDRAHKPAAPPSASAQTEALRDFGLGAQVLADLGCTKIRLLSNTDRKIVGIEGFGIEVVERVALDESSAADDAFDRRLVHLPARGPRGSRADEGK
jgi:3,4-dihydroxy 2-butanone 4-phosphate synthase/GTP cyclohydrolase II